MAVSVGGALVQRSKSTSSYSTALEIDGRVVDTKARTSVPGSARKSLPLEEELGLKEIMGENIYNKCNNVRVFPRTRESRHLGFHVRGLRVRTRSFEETFKLMASAARY